MALLRGEASSDFTVEGKAVPWHGKGEDYFTGAHGGEPHQRACLRSKDATTPLNARCPSMFLRQLMGHRSLSKSLRYASKS